MNKSFSVQMKRREEQRDWAGLNEDILISIFQKAGTIDVLNAQFMCRAWLRVAKYEPEVWRRIDMINPEYNYNVVKLESMVRLAIDRSKGRVEEFWIYDFCYDDLLRYLCHKTSVLKSLRLVACDNVSGDGIVETVKKQPLQELEITHGYFGGEIFDALQESVPNLKQFRLNQMWCNHFYHSLYEMEEWSNEMAFGIAKAMHQLRHLQLVGDKITNSGIKEILEGCPHLETLDIRRCHNVIMDSDMRALCARLKSLRSPDDSLDDYVYIAEEIQIGRDDDVEYVYPPSNGHYYVCTDPDGDEW